MRKWIQASLSLLALAGLLGICAPAWAQEVTASIVGTVTDSSGAPINGADITAIDTERGTSWSAKTNDAGSYSILRLPVGSYTVKITASGFQTVTHPAFTLVLNQTGRIDAQLKVGQASEVVEVTGAAPVLQTDSPEARPLIDAPAVTSVPLASPNYLQLGVLAPSPTTIRPHGTPDPLNSYGR